MDELRFCTTAGNAGEDGQAFESVGFQGGKPREVFWKACDRGGSSSWKRHSRCWTFEGADGVERKALKKQLSDQKLSLKLKDSSRIDACHAEETQQNKATNANRKSKSPHRCCRHH